MQENENPFYFYCRVEGKGSKDNQKFLGNQNPELYYTAFDMERCNQRIGVRVLL